jgi:hypothetical protein
MRTRTCLLLLALATLACHAVERPRSTEVPPEAPFTPEYGTWVAIMEHVIGPGFEETMLGEANRTANAMDLAIIAKAADRCAGHMALGHGQLERRDVPGFAALARETEAWFREIAKRARAGDRPQVQSLIRGGAARYCDRCHEASG